MLNKTLERLGYNEWFEETSRDSIQGNFSAARVVEVNKGNYKVNDGMHEMFAELSGKLMMVSPCDIQTCVPTDIFFIRTESTLTDARLALPYSLLEEGRTSPPKA